MFWNDFVADDNGDGDNQDDDDDHNDAAVVVMVLSRMMISNEHEYDAIYSEVFLKLLIDLSTFPLINIHQVAVVIPVQKRS